MYVYIDTYILICTYVLRVHKYTLTHKHIQIYILMHTCAQNM